MFVYTPAGDMISHIRISSTRNEHRGRIAVKRLTDGAAAMAITMLALAMVIAGNAKASELPPKLELPPLSERVKIHETLRLLTELGYDAAVNDTMKINIEGAIRDFQRDHNLPRSMAR